MTIYLPDDLGKRVKGAELNVSAVCQQALRAELNRLDALRQLDESGAMERVELYDSRRDQQVAFIGQHLASDDRDLFAYRTQHGRIAVIDIGHERLYVYEDFDELAADARGAEQLVGGVAAALGEDYAVLLDI